MLTLLDINRALDRLGGAVFVPRTRRVRLALAAGYVRPVREHDRRRPREVAVAVRGKS